MRGLRTANTRKLLEDQPLPALVRNVRPSLNSTSSSDNSVSNDADTYISENFGPDSFRLHTNGQDDRLHVKIVAEDGTSFDTVEAAAQHDKEEEITDWQTSALWRYILDGVHDMVTDNAKVALVTPVYAASSQMCTAYNSQAMGEPEIIHTKFAPMTAAQQLDFAINAKSFGKSQFPLTSILDVPGLDNPVLFTEPDNTTLGQKIFAQNCSPSVFCTKRTATPDASLVSKPVTFAQAAQPSIFAPRPAINDPVYDATIGFNPTGQAANNASFADLSAGLPKPEPR